MKPKVLFIMHMPPPVHGAAMMGKYIHDSHLVNSTFDCKYVNLTTATSLEDVGKGGIKKIIIYINLLINICKSIHSFLPDIIYLTPNTAGGPFYKDFIIVQLCKLFAKKKTNVVAHFHNKGVATRMDHMLDDCLYRIFFRKLKVILLGKSLYADINKYVHPNNVTYCPNGIPIFKSDIQTRHLDNEVPHILWLTNIMITKGIMEYLDALKILQEHKIAFYADFVGGVTSEMNEPCLNDAIQSRGLYECTKYFGKKYGVEKEEYFQKADVFVLPSYTEAFPLTILEAMAHGVPVVASNVGGVSEMISNGENGFLIGGIQAHMLNSFRPSKTELAEKLELLLKNPTLCRNMGNQGYEKFMKNFTLNSFESRFVKCLNEIAND